MLSIALYTVFLLAAWVSPTLLTLSRYTYGITSAAHFVTFLVSVVLFVLLGRSVQKPGRRRLVTGLGVGALVGAAGTGLSELLRHTPPAERAFVAHLPGVPEPAAYTMLQLHAWVSALLSAGIFAVLFGAFGAVATWWGGLTAKKRRPSPREPASERSNPE